MVASARSRTCTPRPYGPPIQNVSLDDPYKIRETFIDA